MYLGMELDTGNVTLKNGRERRRLAIVVDAFSLKATYQGMKLEVSFVVF